MKGCKKVNRTTLLKHATIIKLLLMMISLFLLAGCSEPPTDIEKVHRPVRVISVSVVEQVHNLGLTGEVIPKEKRQISFMVSGRIAGLWVEEEDDIEVDFLLGKIESLDYETALQGAQAVLQAAHANLDRAMAGASQEEIIEMELQVLKAKEAARFAQQQLERTQALYEAGGVSQLALDQAALEGMMADTSYQQAQAQYQQMVKGARSEEIEALTALKNGAQAEVTHYETQLNRTQLYSPYPGKVADVLYQQGEMYHQGTPFLLLNSPHQRIRVSVSRQQRPLMHVGEDVHVTLGGHTEPGTIAMISSTPDPFTRTYGMEIDIPEGVFTLGDLVRVELKTKGEPAVLLPLQVVLPGNPDYVYVIEDAEAQKIPVEIRQMEEEHVWVTGLEDGQKVVVEGMHLLSQNESVTMLEEVVLP